MHRKRLMHKTIKAKGRSARFWAGRLFACGKKGAGNPGDREMALIFSPARPFAELRQEKMILHKCSLVLCTKMGYNKIKLLP